MATVELEEVEGHFRCFSKKESSEVIIQRCSSHVLGIWLLLGWFNLKHTGPSMPVKSDHDQFLSRHLTDSVQRATAGEKTKVNLAEGPSTTATPSNQFAVKCSTCSHHVYKSIWSPCIGEPVETFCEEDNEHDKYVVFACLNNCLTVVGHIPREITCTCHCFIKNKGEITGEVKDNSAAQQLMKVESTLKYHAC